MLVIAACAVLSGARSYAAISEWADHLGHHMLARLGTPAPAPCESTLRRLLQAVDAPALEAAIGAWPVLVVMALVHRPRLSPAIR